MAQQPSLGRVVHVLVAPVTNNGSDVAPATIVRVHNERPDGSYVVGLKVDLDAATSSKWVQTVPLFESEEAARAHDAGPAAFWPPRV